MRVNNPEMRASLQRFTKARMREQHLTYADLSARLENLGVRQSPAALRAKLSCFTFSAQLFAYLLIALEVNELHLDDFR